MNNNLSLFFRSKIKLKVSGKNIDNFIRKLASKNIELLNINKVKRDTYHIWIYKSDYVNIYKIKTVYNIDIIDASGWIKIRKIFVVNKYFIIALFLGLIGLILLTNLIFDIEVIHNNRETRDFLKRELKNYGIEKYKFKKDYKQLNKIKEDILLRFNDKIEWLEIDTVGIKYVIRVELRETASIKETYINRDLIAKKDATIKKIIAESGQVIGTVNSYVKKGQTIISGTISLNDNIKGLVPAKGKVYGEVWYNTTVEYPFTYYEEKYTGKKKNSLVFEFLNWSLSLPNTKDNYKTVKKYTLLKNNLFPVSLSYQTKKEFQIIDQVLTEEETINAAIELAKKKMLQELDKDEYIISQKNLKINIKNSKIVLESFFVVYEDITDYKDIVLEEIEEQR